MEKIVFNNETLKLTEWVNKLTSKSFSELATAANVIKFSGKWMQ